MIKPDVIVTWPRNCDYPLWRQFIHDNRSRFNVVMIVFMETNQGEDYRQFVRDTMATDWILFADNPETGGRDWRDVAVNHALIQSYNAEWIWFTEQDFIVENPDQFFANLEDIKKSESGWHAVFDGPRMHPCCIFLRRVVLNNIRKDFAAKPPEYDHFGAIQKQIQEGEFYGNSITSGYKHMNGLSHNMSLLAGGGQPNYKPEEFREYIANSLKVSVPIDPRYRALYEGYLAK